MRFLVERYLFSTNVNAGHPKTLRMLTVTIYKDRPVDFLIVTSLSNLEEVAGPSIKSGNMKTVLIFVAVLASTLAYPAYPSNPDDDGVQGTVIRNSKAT